jgi:hypothetical protein
VDWKTVYKSIEVNNPHEGARDALGAIPDLSAWDWTEETVQPDDPRIERDVNSSIGLYPASKRDVKRYMKAYKDGSEFPPIVLGLMKEDKGKFSIWDGAHRLQAAINLGVPIRAYVGTHKGERKQARKPIDVGKWVYHPNFGAFKTYASVPHAELIDKRMGRSMSFGRNYDSVAKGYAYIDEEGRIIRLQTFSHGPDEFIPNEVFDIYRREFPGYAIEEVELEKVRSMYAAKTARLTRDNAWWKGKPFTLGAVSLLDGQIEETHTFEEAEAGDWHHTFIFSPEILERERADFDWKRNTRNPENVEGTKPSRRFQEEPGGTVSIFWVTDEGKIGCNQPLPAEIESRIMQQIRVGKTAAAQKPTPVQLDALRRMANGRELCRHQGGFWTTEPVASKDAFGVPKDANGETVWYVPTRTVEAMEKRGWVVRTNKYPEAWKDDRKIADAGLALVTGKTAATYWERFGEEHAKSLEGLRTDPWVEHVPVKDLLPLQEYNWSQDRNRMGREKWDELVEDMRKHGVREPITIRYFPDTKEALIIEGNHRVSAATAAGLEEVPARVTIASYPKADYGTNPDADSPGAKVPGRKTEEHPYQDYIAPSDIGLPGRKTAAEVPERMYHYTKKDFKEFDPMIGGPHGEFGTHLAPDPKQVENFGGEYEGFGGEGRKPPTGARVIPVKVNIKNPVRLEDKGTFNPNEVLSQLRQNKVITREEQDALVDLKKDFEVDPKALRDLLLSKGYDGIVYLNRREGVRSEIAEDDSMDDASDQEFLEKYPEANGNDSYIALKSDQIKSLFAAFSPQKFDLWAVVDGHVEIKRNAPGRMTHADWFREMGIPDKGHLFDSTPRGDARRYLGRIHLRESSELNGIPQDVVAAFERLYPDTEVVAEWTTVASGRKVATETFLYHGTSRAAFKNIVAGSGLMTSPSFWGSAAIANYYAEQEAEAAVGTDDEGFVILRVPMSRFDKNKFAVDNASVHDPITTVLDDEHVLQDRWSASKKTWKDSLAVYESVVYNAPMKISDADVYEEFDSLYA